jgi:hypothetical protein
MSFSSSLVNAVPVSRRTLLETAGCSCLGQLMSSFLRGAGCCCGAEERMGGVLANVMEKLRVFWSGGRTTIRKIEPVIGLSVTPPRTHKIYQNSQRVGWS